MRIGESMIDKDELYNNILLDIVAYLRTQEGWSEEYAKEVVFEQVSKIGREEYTRRVGGVLGDKMSAIEYFRDIAGPREYERLVDQLYGILSKYKRREDADEMGRKMRLIIKKYI